MSYILTKQHIHFDLLNPTEEMVNIKDIAHALGHICRFTGHTNRFYSVAEHCIYVSYIVKPEFALEALLHDAQEAYVGDVSQPLKQLIPDYRAIEDRIEKVIRARFGLPEKMSPEVKKADLQMLMIERGALGLNDGTAWPILEGIEKPAITLWMQREIRTQPVAAFCHRFIELYGAS